ncbi:MAG TPA: hypothetical protein ENK23_05600 [Sorangium sp.]|nr:hypothetical protein [Sorangium sp.]
MTELARRWHRTLASVQQPQLRVGFARSEIYARPSEDVAAALQHIAKHAELYQPSAQSVLHAFVPLLVQPTHLPRLAELRQIAHDQTLTALFRLLRCTTYKGHMLQRVDDKLTSLPNTGQGRVLSLGERRALARKPSRAQLHRLLDDPHPMVVHILLNNPRITEDDIVRMAARRPAHAPAVAEIAAARTRSRRVRLALIQNPSAPAAVTIPLLALLSRPELLQVSRAADLQAVVRDTALQRWCLRPPIDGTPHSDAVH